MPASRKPFPGVWVSLLLVVLVALGQAGLGLLLGRFLAANLLLAVSAVNVAVLGSVSAVGFLLAREAPAWARGRSVDKTAWTAVPLTAVGGALVLGFAADLISRILPLPKELERLLGDLAGQPAQAVLALMVVAPLTEELLFRGLIQRGLDRRYGFMTALLVTSALFAILHVSPVQAVPAFAAGLYLGWLYRSTGTLWWPMAAHALFNGTSLVLALLMPDADPAASTPWPLAVVGAALLAWGLALSRTSFPLSPPGDSDTVAP